MLTETDIARMYPYLLDDHKAKALDIWNSAEAFMAKVSDDGVIESADMRRMLQQQIAQARHSAVQVIGQK